MNEAIPDSVSSMVSAHRSYFFSRLIPLKEVNSTDFRVEYLQVYMRSQRFDHGFNLDDTRHYSLWGKPEAASQWLNDGSRIGFINAVPQGEKNNIVKVHGQARTFSGTRRAIV